MFPVIKYYSITYLLVSYWQITLPTFFPFPSMWPAPSKDEEVYQCYKQKIWGFFFHLVLSPISWPIFHLGIFFSSKESLTFFLAFNLFSPRRINWTREIVSRIYTISPKRLFLPWNLILNHFRKSQKCGSSGNFNLDVYNFLKTQGYVNMRSLFHVSKKFSVKNTGIKAIFLTNSSRYLWNCVSR